MTRAGVAAGLEAIKTGTAQGRHTKAEIVDQFAQGGHGLCADARAAVAKVFPMKKSFTPLCFAT